MSPPRAHHRCWIALALVAFVLGGGQVWAGESPWYVTARFGEASAEAQLGDRHPQRIDDEAGSAAVDVGYEINRYLAVEAGYQDLGSHAGFGSPCLQTDDACIERLAGLGLCVEGSECAEILAALNADFSGLSVALLPTWPVTERLAVRGKIGLMAWDGDVTAVSFGVSERFSSEDLLTGLGVLYSFPGGLGILIQHEELDLDAGTTSLGLRWRF